MLRSLVGSEMCIRDRQTPNAFCNAKSDIWNHRKAFESYSCRDVAAFMRKQEEFISRYADVFETRGVNGKVLLSLTDEELSDELGVIDKIHRKAILLMTP